jgi:hypothetical protein
LEGVVNMEMHFMKGERVKLTYKGGQYSTYEKFFTEGLSRDNLKKYARNFHTNKDIPLNTPLEILTYGLHSNSDDIVYVLKDVNDPESIYLYALQTMGGKYVELAQGGD